MNNKMAGPKNPAVRNPSPLRSGRRPRIGKANRRFGNGKLLVSDGALEGVEKYVKNPNVTMATSRKYAAWTGGLTLTGYAIWNMACSKEPGLGAVTDGLFTTLTGTGSAIGSLVRSLPGSLWNLPYVFSFNYASSFLLKKFVSSEVDEEKMASEREEPDADKFHFWDMVRFSTKRIGAALMMFSVPVLGPHFQRFISEAEKITEGIQEAARNVDSGYTAVVLTAAAFFAASVISKFRTDAAEKRILDKTKIGKDAQDAVGEETVEELMAKLGVGTIDACSFMELQEAERLAQFLMDDDCPDVYKIPFDPYTEPDRPDKVMERVSAKLKELGAGFNVELLDPTDPETGEPIIDKETGRPIVLIAKEGARMPGFPHLRAVEDEQDAFHSESEDDDGAPFPGEEQASPFASVLEAEDKGMFSRAFSAVRNRIGDSRFLSKFSTMGSAWKSGSTLPKKDMDKACRKFSRIVEKASHTDFALSVLSLSSASDNGSNEVMAQKAELLSTAKDRMEWLAGGMLGALRNGGTFDADKTQLFADAMKAYVKSANASRGMKFDTSETLKLFDGATKVRGRKGRELLEFPDMYEPIQ